MVTIYTGFYVRRADVQLFNWNDHDFFKGHLAQSTLPYPLRAAHGDFGICTKMVPVALFDPGQRFGHLHWIDRSVFYRIGRMDRPAIGQTEG